MSDSVSTRRRNSFAGYALPFVFVSAAVGAVVLVMKGWFPSLASEHGAGVDRLIIYLLISTGIIMVVGHFVLAYFVWRFSRQGSVSFRRPSPRAEKIWLFVPMVIIGLIAEGGVLGIGLPVWSQIYGEAAASSNKVTVVEVTGEQFGWNIRYPGPDGLFGKIDPKLIGPSNKIGLVSNDPAGKDDIVDFGTLHLPAGVPARLQLRSKDVIHSFFLPNLRVKQDLMPGMTIETRFTPTKADTFEIACTELCGLGHFQMRGILVVSEQHAFDSWLKEQKPLLEPTP